MQYEDTLSTAAPTEIIALMRNSWGRGVTPKEAFENAAVNATSMKEVKFFRVPTGKYTVSGLDGTVMYEKVETNKPLGELDRDPWDLVTQAVAHGFSTVSDGLQYVLQNEADPKVQRKIESFLEKVRDLEVDVDELLEVIEEARDA